MHVVHSRVNHFCSNLVYTAHTVYMYIHVHVCTIQVLILYILRTVYSAFVRMNNVKSVYIHYVQ